MPFNQDLDRLRAVGTETLFQEEWRGFGQYLELRAKGVRKAAMEALRSFVATAQHWDFESRAAFVRWMSDRTSGFLDARQLIPHDLLTNLVAPTIREWLALDPESSLAYCLSGEYCRGEDPDPLPLDAFRRSVALDPGFDRARRAFIDWVCAHAEHHQHELPYYGYLGPVDEDVHDLTEAQLMLADVERPLWRDEIGAKLAELLETAKAWQRFERSGGEDFRTWCEANDGPERFLLML